MPSQVAVAKYWSGAALCARHSIAYGTAYMSKMQDLTQFVWHAANYLALLLGCAWTKKA